MMSSAETWGDEKAIRPVDKLVLVVAQTEERFVGEMKVAEGLYMMVVRSLGINKIEEEGEPKIMIPEKVQP